jgi:uncharacterized protein YehS (DUF1456 family)
MFGATVVNNIVIHRIIQLLEADSSTLEEIFKLSGHPLDQIAISGFLKTPDESGSIECNDTQMIFFLDGLITYRRGKSENQSAQKAQTQALLTNNSILKKLRIAFNLKEDDLINLMAIAEFDITKNEISAIFRKEGHKHYRECSDDFLQAFIHGLSFRKWAH